MPAISADYLLTPHGLMPNQVLELDEKGNILDLRIKKNKEQTIHHEGVLTPGFVNAHCHLELSALVNRIPAGKGMTGFIREVVGIRREIPTSELEAASGKALAEMYEQGVQVLGDISNDLSSLPAKLAHSEVFTHTFVELLGLIPDRAPQILETATTTRDVFREAGLSSSLTLHAPYSVSAALRDSFYALADGPISLHLMESTEEVQWFRENQGPFGEFFSGLGLPAPEAEGLSPERYLLQHAPPKSNGIFVHLTEADETTLAWLDTQFPEMYFCLCPRSNEYLHGTLPDMARFQPFLDRICLGTDSLASCPDLNVLQEAVALKKAFPALSTRWLLDALTAHGAKALGLAEKFGYFRTGTAPGVIQIQGIDLDKNTWRGINAQRIY